MKDIKFRVWHHKENKMYFRGYQKWLWALLCEDDRGANNGQGKPVRRAFYGDCTFLESTGLFDRNQKEIFEGDLVKGQCQGKFFKGVVESPPDTFGAGKAHPLKALLARHGIQAYPQSLEIEVIGNAFENPALDGPE